ncbi:hypothetical protein ACFQNE_14105 [Gordonia phosphorivorans]|uniref:Uncharacterized protein n=1 Tax=Gordonia phosphorivorans TaxID=1056982 RepID=A0ABV6H7Q2_9ACTN
MSGPDHYRAAEQLLAQAEQRGAFTVPELLAAAQAHATLAAAQAAALTVTTAAKFAANTSREAGSLNQPMARRVREWESVAAPSEPRSETKLEQIPVQGIR